MSLHFALENRAVQPVNAYAASTADSPTNSCSPPSGLSTISGATDLPLTTALDPPLLEKWARGGILTTPRPVRILLFTSEAGPSLFFRLSRLGSNLRITK